MIWISFPIPLWGIVLVFASSVLIDFDHYLWYVVKKKDWSLKNAYNFLRYTDHGKTLMVFHTVEFLVLTAILSYWWIGFFYIFTGMIFHSALDIMEMGRRNLKYREFFLVRVLF